MNHSSFRARFAFVLLALTTLLFCRLSAAAEWPTFRHDIRRSGVTKEKVDPPLTEAWVYHPKHPPDPAWPPPAKADFWHKKPRLNPRMTFDRAFHVALAGDGVYFGSSADDKVYCLDAATGRERWSFFTEGPVRLAPTVAGGKVYVGSDDGFVYCLDAANGRLLWRCNPSGDDRRVIGNGRMISIAPVRAGVAVIDGPAYCGAGIFPLQGVFLAALDASTGEIIWKQSHDFSPQGYLLASADRLYVPTGRTSPMVFSRADGKRLGEYKGSAGAYALVTEDLIVYGPGDSGQLGLSETGSRDHLATFNGLTMIIDGSVSYLHSKTALSALDRVLYLDLVRKRRDLSAKAKAVEEELKKLGKNGSGGEAAKLEGALNALKEKAAACTLALPGCTLWERPCDHPYTLILAGDSLFVGGEDGVAAFSTQDGQSTWSTKIPGRAYGLAAARGRLYVSTDTGSIHCFVEGAPR